MNIVTKILKTLFGGVKRLRKLIAKYAAKAVKIRKQIAESETTIRDLRTHIRNTPHDPRVPSWEDNIRNLEAHIERLTETLNDILNKIQTLKDELNELLS